MNGTPARSPKKVIDGEYKPFFIIIKNNKTVSEGSTNCALLSRSKVKVK